MAFSKIINKRVSKLWCIQIDRKRLKKLQEKRIALGHKPDDHEHQWPDMTM